MSNLTISIDDHLIKQARVRAIQQGTSLSAKIREYIAAYASGTADRLSGDATTDLRADLAADHRVMDGAEAARFLETLQQEISRA